MSTFIDAHVHVQPWEMMKPEIVARMSRHRSDMETIRKVMSSPRNFLHLMDQDGVECTALINYVSPHIMGFTDDVNEWISDFCQENPGRLLPFGSVDLMQKTGQASRVDHLLVRLKLRGFKIHPSHQTVYPNDYLSGNDTLAYIYKRCESEGIPVMFHTGTSIFVGARNRFADPIYVDDVAVDFPNLKIILAHGGRPIWMDTCIFLVRRFPNVYMDISSIPPLKVLEYFPRLEDFAHKVLFGSDWPAPLVRGMKENFDQFSTIPLSTESKMAIGSENARKVLSL